MNKKEMFQFGEMKRIFIAQEDQQVFERDGYLTKTFYSVETLEKLRERFAQDHKKITGFYSSTFSHDFKYRKETDLFIQEISKPYLKQVFQGHKVIHSSYIAKNNDGKSQMNVHQDMTLLDESRFTGINIWVPLIDLNEENGALYVLPKSHRGIVIACCNELPN